MTLAMAMDGPVSTFVRQRVERELQRHRVLVWYDPDRSFARLFEALDLQRTRKLALGDSYFALRREAEAHAGRLKAGDAGENLLVYVPAHRLDARCNVLLPLELLGGRFEERLDAVARDALRGRVATKKLEEWRALPNLTLEKWDALAESEEGIGSLEVVFGKVGPRQVAFHLLRYEEKIREVEQQLLLEPLRELLDRTFGVAIPEEVQDGERMRDAFVQRVLLIEFLSDLQAIPKELSDFSLPEPASKVAACRELAQQLRETKGLEAQYRQWADRAVRLFGVDRLEYDAEQLGRRDTFEFEADYALRHVQELALSDRWEDARAWIENRSRSFWAEVDQTRAQRWKLARVATDLWLTAERLAKQLPSRKQPPAAWVEMYTRPEGGWEVDLLLRRLNAAAGALPPGDDLAALVERARERAEAMEQTQAERFLDSLAAAPGSLADLPAQADVYAKHVAPLVRSARTVFVLADALRLEMAHELAEMLEPTGAAELAYAVATPPTITKVGMAALVPGAEAGIGLVASGDGVAPEVGGEVLPAVTQRLKRFEAELGGSFADLTLDACLSLKPAQLEKQLQTVRLLVLRVQDLDAIGEMDSLHAARTLMGAVLTNLHQAMNRLSHLGFEEFVVCADHGYLLREDVGEAMKLEKPAGDVLELHRRCAIGRHLGSGEHYAIFKAADFGVGGDLELAFPRGINVFKTPGNMVYHHGGLSLQELVIPVLRYTPTVRREAAKKPAVTLELKGGRKVTNAIFQVTLSFQALDLFDEQRRRFRVTVVDPSTGKQVGKTALATDGFREAGAEVELDTGRTSTLVLQLTDPPTGSGDLELHVADVDAGETILRKKVKYDLAF